MPTRDPALRAIVLYKLIRGGLSVLAALLLATVIARGGAASLESLARALREHWTTGVSGHAAAWLLHVLDVRHAWLATTGLLLDGLVTSVEGFALQRGYRWGYWLVVLVAAAFVPFELWSWLHKPTIGRALLLLSNVAVAAYLARRVLREPQAQRSTNTR
ncbi:MAG TPA: DUF2127 domain-containing protein [Polyangiales bacterium]|nr:DUF2127 domain-containing protein [Polyangiales bacterium]